MKAERLCKYFPLDDGSIRKHEESFLVSLEIKIIQATFIKRALPLLNLLLVTVIRDVAATIPFP